jgi:hypothetical protein
MVKLHDKNLPTDAALFCTKIKNIEYSLPNLKQLTFPFPPALFNFNLTKQVSHMPEEKKKLDRTKKAILFNFALPESLRDEFLCVCNHNDVSGAAVLRRLMRAWIEDNKPAAINNSEAKRGAQ